MQIDIQSLNQNLKKQLPKRIVLGNSLLKNRDRFIKILEDYQHKEDGLSVAEILIIYSARHNRVLTRTYVQTELGRLVKNLKIKRIQWGRYSYGI